ncbi:MAG: T9SS type A sorting domain-containing protein [Bacteroidales bacterium]|nr:T9SS type A sorting domain-containing protein [Bacteroidales bacterium]
MSTQKTGSCVKTTPNPVSDGKLTVDTPVGVAASVVEIFDLNGTLVLTLSINRPKTEIQVSHLPNGTYVVKVGSALAKIVKY